MHTYVTNQELKKKALTVTRQNMKQAISIQLTFILEIKLQKEHFLGTYHIFSARDVSILSSY